MSPNAPSVMAQAGRPRLRVGQGLQARLALLFILVAMILVLVAWQVGKALVQRQLVGDVRRYQHESGLRLVREVEARLQLAQVLASGLAELSGTGAPSDWVPRVPALVAQSGLGGLIAAIGWWPEPVPGGAARDSRFWLADGVGALQLREDYNDNRAIAYWEEPWYTPARYAAMDECYWTRVYTERLSQRRVVACTMPLRDGKQTRGAVTVLLDAALIEQLLRTVSAGQSGYTLLVDRDNRLIATSGAAVGKLGATTPRNLAELAQRLPSFNTLALDLHQRDEDFLSRAAQSPQYDAARIAELRLGTREASRQEAESDLALIWNASSPRGEPPPEELRIRQDGVLGEDASGTIFELPGPYWKLIRVTPEREGVAGAQHFFGQTLLILCAALVLTLLLIFAGLHLLVLKPLAGMAARLSDTRALEQSLHLQLDERASSELGVIAHWYNERVRQLTDSMDRVLSQQSQLVVESSERARADEQSLRLRERAAAVLSSVADAAIVVDARGVVEDMNVPAERLTGASLRAVRGRPCSEILHVRLSNRGGAVADFAATVIASGGRIDHSDGLFLHVEGRSEREIQLTGSPLRGPGGRSLGAVLVFRPREAQATSPKVVIERRSVDSVTGLPTRAACDRRIRAMLESVPRVQSHRHALLVGDIDRLRTVNQLMGMQAGDEVLVRVAETLVATAPGADIFRLGGDSFAVLIEDSTSEDALRIGRGLCEAVANLPLQWAERKLAVTASFGLVLFESGNEHPMELLRRAEDACLTAKQAGRNTVRAYDPSMIRPPATSEAIWVRRIRSGLDEGLLRLISQSIAPAEPHQREGAVFDVSLTLEDEEGFWAEAADFLPVAERTGLVAEVERWVLRQTLEQLARSPAVVGRLAFCCITLSAQTVSEGATLEMIAQLFQEYPEVPPGRVCLAMRETVLHEAPGPALMFCEALRSLGCRVAMDHFDPHGVAGADLLQRLPANFMRIDARHFVDLVGSPLEQSIADSAIRLARTLERRVIVTGIGDEAARDTWKRLGADYLQGLVVARPSPVVFSVKG